jgi:hypothetical protein
VLNQAEVLGLVWTTSIAGRNRTTRPMAKAQVMAVERPDLKVVHCTDLRSVVPMAQKFPIQWH